MLMSMKMSCNTVKIYFFPVGQSSNQPLYTGLFRKLVTLNLKNLFREILRIYLLVLDQMYPVPRINAALTQLMECTNGGRNRITYHFSIQDMDKE
jgi:hypothetical protein